MTLLGRIEFYHSRAIAPTRRVALGACNLTFQENTPFGFGGILLGAIVGKFVQHIDEERRNEYEKLLTDLEMVGRIPQPRLQHRFQSDRVGLTRSRCDLLRDNTQRSFVLHTDANATPTQALLAAAYATARVPSTHRGAVFHMMKILTRQAENTTDLFAFLGAYGSDAVFHLPGETGNIRWACDVLEVDPEQLTAMAVQRAFREKLRTVHPDLGAHAGSAGVALDTLTRARAVLLAYGVAHSDAARGANTDAQAS